MVSYSDNTITYGDLKFDVFMLNNDIICNPDPALLKSEQILYDNTCVFRAKYAEKLDLKINRDGTATIAEDGSDNTIILEKTKVYENMTLYTIDENNSEQEVKHNTQAYVIGNECCVVIGGTTFIVFDTDTKEIGERSPYIDDVVFQNNTIFFYGDKTKYSLAINEKDAITQRV